MQQFGCHFLGKLEKSFGCLLTWLAILTPGAAGVQMPRVSWHPLKCSNGCQPPVLRRPFVTKRLYFFKNSKILCILGVNFVCYRIFLSWAPVFWKFLYRPCPRFSLELCKVHFIPRLYFPNLTSLNSKMMALHKILQRFIKVSQSGHFFLFHSLKSRLLQM